MYLFNFHYIQGRDPTTGKPYEELLCEDTGRKGLLMMGDSASAHFHLPAQWLRVAQINKVKVS